MARRPSEFTGTALEISPPLTMDLVKEQIGHGLLVLVDIPDR